MPIAGLTILRMICLGDAWIDDRKQQDPTTPLMAFPTLKFAAQLAVIQFVWLTLSAPVFAQQEPPPADAAIAGQTEYTKRGADTCLKCHDEDNEYPIMPIFNTKHAQMADKRTPFAGRQCEACHGPGRAHAKKVRPGKKQGPILNFGKNSKAPPELQNKACLTCHQDSVRTGWHGSVHEQYEVACADCHQVHKTKDPVLVKAEQSSVCFNCHSKERSEFHRASVHPVRFGELSCSECHEPHDSLAPGLLVRSTLNETCYTCHAEKRGPFLWEHAPVIEDCALCHEPHGSNHPALLKKRPPLLCQQCHSQAGHPSLAYSGTGLPGGPDTFSRQFMLGKGCVNCHSRIHGSNHPSGVKLMR